MKLIPNWFSQEKLVSWTCKAVIHTGKCDKIIFSDYIYLMFFLFVCFSWSSLWKVIQCMSLSRFFWEDRMTTLSHIFRVCSVLSLWSKYFVQATHFRRGHFNANSRCIYFNTVWISKQTWCFVKKSCQLFSYLKRVFVQGNKTLFFYWPSVEIVYLHVVFVFCTGQT